METSEHHQENILRSYISEPWRGPIPYCTVPERLLYYATKSPQKEAVIIIGKSNRTAVTYKELLEKDEEMANKFLTLGIEKDDVVAIHDEKTAMWLYCTVGLQMCGAWPLHFFFQQKDATDVIYILKQSQCKYLLLHPGENDNFVDIVRKLEFVEGEGTLVSLKRVIFTEAPKMPTAHAILNLIPITRNVRPSEIDPETIAAIFCSSGTT